MPFSPNFVEHVIREAFPNANLEAILAQLNAYGTEPHERERERVQLTIIKLCEGDPDKLAQQIAIAKVDYRDVLMFADRPLPSTEEGAKLQTAAREVLHRWGKQ